MSWFWGTRKVEEFEVNGVEEEETKSFPTTAAAAADDDDDDDEEEEQVHADDSSRSQDDNNKDDGGGHYGENEDHDDDGHLVPTNSSTDHESEDEEDSDTDSDTDDDDDDEHDEKSLHSLTTEEDDISFIDSDEADSMDDEDYEDSDDEDNGHDDDHDRDHQSSLVGESRNDTSQSNQDDKNSSKSNINNKHDGRVSNEKKDAGSDDDDGDDDQIPSSFWEKRGLLVLAAEHDRVDILNAVLKDDDDGDKERLMNSGGVPPLHLAITFSSVNTAIALLRMGADPSVRPDIQQILEDEKTQPQDSKVEIPHMERFDGASAWELAFGNDAYEKFKTKKSSSRSWSLFGGGSSSADFDSDDEESEGDGSKQKKKKQIIKPADMPPSKREGIRHAFTAEALRSVGGDEVERLLQLIDAGMPATVDIGGKDLYGWTVEMGALKCEEALRHVEASKHPGKSDGVSNSASSATTRESAIGDPAEEVVDTATQKENESAPSSGVRFKVHRPTNETVPQLRNRLDELESLASALSTCLDNLAEEVSVCHGLLLLGGGASTLASHVKSLKALKEQKLQQLEDSELECQKVEQELFDLANSVGTIGEKILNSSTSQLDFHFKCKADDEEDEDRHDSDQVVQDDEESEEEKRYLLAQIAVTEHKTRKLRASISDLSEENARDMTEVERRGLEGGINLVRGIREELRDVEFQLSEIQSLRTTYRAKISMIHAQAPSISTPRSSDSERKHNHSSTDDMPSVNGKFVDDEDGFTEVSRPNRKMEQHESTTEHTDQEAMDGRNDHSGWKEADTVSEHPLQRQGTTKPSEKIASGDSRAIQVIRPGHHGFFPLDLWQVLLRIIGFERAAYRRGMQQQQQQQQQQQTKTKKSPPPPNTFIV